MASVRTDGFVYNASPTTDEYFTLNGTALYGRSFSRADFIFSRFEDVTMAVVEVTKTLTCGNFYRAVAPVGGDSRTAAIIGTYCGDRRDDEALLKVIRGVRIQLAAVPASTSGRVLSSAPDQRPKDGSELFLQASKQGCLEGTCGESPVYLKIWYNDGTRSGYVLNGYIVYDGRTIMNKKKYLALHNNDGNKVCEGYVIITSFDEKTVTGKGDQFVECFEDEIQIAGTFKQEGRQTKGSYIGKAIGTAIGTFEGGKALIVFGLTPEELKRRKFTELWRAYGGSATESPR